MFKMLQDKLFELIKRLFNFVLIFLNIKTNTLKNIPTLRSYPFIGHSYLFFPNGKITKFVFLHFNFFFKENTLLNA